MISSMTIEVASWFQSHLAGTQELLEVTEVTTALRDHLNLPTIQTELEIANQPGASSALVQSVFLTEAVRLEFRSEAKGLFAGYPTAAVRPDYYRPMPSHRSGILLEVERGKTTINNMDFLDFWKCHICSEAHHLILLVPRVLKQNADKPQTTKPFNAVSKRLGSFFQPENYTNVRSCWLFGY